MQMSTPTTGDGAAAHGLGAVDALPAADVEERPAGELDRQPELLPAARLAGGGELLADRLDPGVCAFGHREPGG